MPSPEQRAAEYRKNNPEPLTPEWRRKNVEGGIKDLDRFLGEMDPEEASRYATDLQSLLAKKYIKKQSKIE